MRLILGECLEKLREMEDNSVDSIVTDPPYGISFMGKKWDYDVPSTEIWRECLRVLKPGGHLLSFAGSRTYHRMAVNIEDAGFEIRDQLMWIYGSGFPKSHNIGKGVDKKLGNEREVIGISKGKGYTSIQEKNLEHGNRPYVDGLPYEKADRTLTKGNSEWEGWGTALKPAHEPIVMARKPLSEKTVVDNVLEWGTGGINIDGSRITHNEPIKVMKAQEGGNKVFGQAGRYQETTELKPEGRFPANILLSEEAAENLDQSTEPTKGNKKPRVQKTSRRYGENNFTSGGLYAPEGNITPTYNDEGGVSRYFYVAKPSKKEKDLGLTSEEKTQKDLATQKTQHLIPDKNNNDKLRENPYLGATSGVRKNTHPTVKPIKLMEYLIKMVTPVGGTTLDPFMGSGSTGVAALQNGFDFIGIEMEQEYMDIAKQRINASYQTKLDI